MLLVVTHFEASPIHIWFTTNNNKNKMDRIFFLYLVHFVVSLYFFFINIIFLGTVHILRKPIFGHFGP